MAALLSQVVYAHLPRQRKMDAEDTTIAQNLLRLKSNMKMVQVHMQDKTGKVFQLMSLDKLPIFLQNIKILKRTTEQESEIIVLDNYFIFVVFYTSF